MFQLVHNWFDRRANPIGIDFGTDCLRMAQVAVQGSEAKLIAAASVEVPAPIREDRQERLTFLTDAVADLWRTEHFHGRRAVLALPAAVTTIHQIRLDSHDPINRGSAVAKTIQMTTSLNVDELLVRHQAVIEAGDGKNDVIAVSASRCEAASLLSAMQSAGLDVIAMNTEAGAVCDFYNHVYRRVSHRQSMTWLIDIGYEGTRIYSVQDQKLFLAITAPFGGRHLTQAVADAFHISTDAARMLRLKHSRTDATAVGANEQHVVYVAPPRDGINAMKREHAMLELATRPVVDSLYRMFRQTRDRFQNSKTGGRVDRLLFIGGESRDRRLCEHISRTLGITGCVGDPLLRMGRISDVCVASGIDRRQPQPAWATAIGLSLGPVHPESVRAEEDPLAEDSSINR